MQFLLGLDNAKNIYGIESGNTIPQRVVSDAIANPLSIIDGAEEISLGKDIVEGANLGRTVEKTVETTEKTLTKAEERAAKLSETDRSGKDFTKAGKDAVKDVNAEKKWGRYEMCELRTACGKMERSILKGVTPPSELKPMLITSIQRRKVEAELLPMAKFYVGIVI